MQKGNYMLSITNDTPDSDLWLWSWSPGCQTCQGSFPLFDFGNGPAWSCPYGTSLTFDIYGAPASPVPEPSGTNPTKH
jgi:hypothetical protein